MTGMHPKLLQARIVALIENTRINVSTEASAHAAISAALTTGNIDHTCEVRLTDKERIDIMAGTVGIEIKVKGSRNDIYRQLQRYAALPEVDALILVTAMGFPRTLNTIDTVPFAVASLSRGWL